MAETHALPNCPPVPEGMADRGALVAWPQGWIAGWIARDDGDVGRRPDAVDYPWLEHFTVREMLATEGVELFCAVHRQTILEFWSATAGVLPSVAQPWPTLGQLVRAASDHTLRGVDLLGETHD